MNIYDALNNLEKAVSESEEVKKYKKAKEAIKGDADKEKILVDLRAKQMELQAIMMSGQEIPEEKQKELEKFSEIVKFNPTINEFLEAEYFLSRIFDDVTKGITKSFDFWIPEMDNKEE